MLLAKTRYWAKFCSWPKPAKEEAITTKERLASAARPARTVFRKEVELAVNDAVGASQASVAAELGDLRRILTDDMDATNEATAVFGRMLAKLADRLEEVTGQLAAIDARLDALATAAPGRPAAAQAAPASRKRAGGKAVPTEPAGKPAAAAKE